MNRTLVTIAWAVLAFVLVIKPTGQQAAAAQAGNDVEAQIMKVDEDFRMAKLKNDTAALDRVLADNFLETNQNGNTRNKAEIIELFKVFKIMSLTTDDSQVRITGDTAVVTGSQTEQNFGGQDRMLFMRVYVNVGQGWQLVASMQLRSPK